MLDNDFSFLLTNGYLRPQERGNGDANQDDLSTTTNEATPEPGMILNADEKLIQMLASVSMPISATEELGIVAPPSLIQLAGDNEVFEKPGSRSRGGMELANLVDAVNGVDIVWSLCDVAQDFGLTEVDANEGDRIRDLARFLVTCIPCEERGSPWGQDAAPMPFSFYATICSRQLGQLQRDAKKWKNDEATEGNETINHPQKKGDFQKKKDACRKAIERVKSNGNFSKDGKKSFKTAMEVRTPDGTMGSVAEALTTEKLLAILAVESSFGTNYHNTGAYRGPFQLGEKQVEDYNAANGTNLKWPESIDCENGPEGSEFDTAAEVAAWYLASQIQLGTLRQSADPRTNFTTKQKHPGGPISDPSEANAFGLAAYARGFQTEIVAREQAEKAGKKATSWMAVKDHYPGGNDGEPPINISDKEKSSFESSEEFANAKKTEKWLAQNYVDKAHEFEKQFKE